MADFAISHYVNKVKNAEKFRESSAGIIIVQEQVQPDPIANLVSLIIFITAFYLSWNCNSDKTEFERIVRALIAGMFGTIYIILYVFVFRKDCMTLREKTLQQFGYEF